MKKYLLGATLLISSIMLGACGNGSTNSSTADSGKKDEKIQAVATFYPMYEFTKEVIGDAGEVELLIPAGTEPHDFEPSAKDMAKISDADVFVYNSDELETWADGVKSNSKNTEFIEAADKIDLMEGDGEGHDHEADHDHESDESHEDHEHESEESHDDHDHSHELDPHVWLDPVLAQKEVEEIRDELIEKYPDQKETFTKNAENYIEKLSALDKSYSDSFKNAKNRTFVTQHAAFGYLAKRYNLTQEAIAGISPDQEPSPSRIAELKHYVDDHGVKVIYFEENASSKVAETLSKETGVKLEVLNPIESLTNKQIDDGETYIGVMEQNLEALKDSIN